MALDDAKKFVDRVATDKAFRSKLGAALQPFLEAAKEHGYNFSPLELQAAIRHKFGPQGAAEDDTAVIAHSS
jgi:predicted ribosomally synthesized peptide with nif11-like leader